MGADAENDVQPDQEVLAVPPVPEGESAPDYMEDRTISYLAYLLREAELTRLNVQRIRRNTSVIIALLAIAIIILIIIWLDITGAISIF